MKACRVFSLFICLLFITLSGRPVEASEPETRRPIKVKVGIYLLNVGKLDIGAGTYGMDFYISFRCSEDCQPGNFEILNGRASVEKNDDEPRFKVVRGRADLVLFAPFEPMPNTIGHDLRGARDHASIEAALRAIGATRLRLLGRPGCDPALVDVFEGAVAALRWGIDLGAAAIGIACAASLSEIASRSS